MITLSPTALQELKRLAQEMALDGQGLRFFIEGGCCGKSYGMGFDDPKDADHIHEFEGLKILVDPESAPYIQGLAIDFVDGEEGSGFEILSEAPAMNGCCQAKEGESMQGSEGGCCQKPQQEAHAPSNGGCCRQ
jgi:iron-sulfur cluster assembly protein